MPIANLHALDEEAFNERLRDFIVQVEGNERLPYFDTANPARVTIGIGFNIDIPGNLTRVVTAMGLSGAEQASISNALRSVRMAEIRAMPQGTLAQRNARSQALRAHLDAALGRPFAMTQDQINTVFGQVSQDHLRAIDPLIPELSLERLALTSMHFNTPALIGRGLRTALAMTDPHEARAEVWYQIRYSHANELHWRRYAEAALFGLYGEAVPQEQRVDQAHAIYRMYARHGRQDYTRGSGVDMVAYENRFAGDRANGQSRLTGAQLGHLQVQHLREELRPAANVLVQQFVTGANIVGAPTFDPLNIQAAFGNSELRGEDTTTRTGFDADLLIGRDNAIDRLSGLGGRDVLIGRGGNDHLAGGADRDILHGGQGEDRLDGGSGDDTLDGGAGADTYLFLGAFGRDHIADASGDGNLTTDNGVLLGGARSTDPSDPFDGWLGNVGGVTYLYTFEQTDSDGGGTLRIHRAGDTDNVIEVEHWSDGELGIHLQPPEDGRPWSPVSGITIFNGDVRPLVDYAVEQNPRYAWEDVTVRPDGTLEHGVTDVGFSTVLEGTSGTDDMQGGGGEDALNGMGGNDSLTGGVGNDLIGGGAGSDYLSGGDGNDVLLGSAELDVAQRFGPNDQVTILGAGRLLIEGPTWALYQPTGEPVHLLGAGNQIDEQSNEYIRAGAGDDWAFGGMGADMIDGGTGHDHLYGGSGADLIEGGEGDDQLSGDDNVAGGDRPGWLNTDPGGPDASQHGEDQLNGGAGNDGLWGEGGNDVLSGGADNDTLYGDSGELPGAYHGQDSLLGEDGDDVLVGGGSGDVLQGGEGADNLAGDVAGAALDAAFHGDDALEGEGGNDTLRGDGGHDTLLGGDGADLLRGDALDASLPLSAQGDDVLDGGIGEDDLIGGGGNDVLSGGDDADVLLGDDEVSVVEAPAHGADTLDGGVGNDTLLGGGGDDSLEGGDGSDWLAGEDELAGNAVSLLTGDDTLSGNAGADVLLGGNGNDQMYGGDDNDWMNGGGEADMLLGGSGHDTLLGGDGHDTLSGGVGVDLLDGEGGDDTYVLSLDDIAVEDNSVDVVADSAGTNHLQLGVSASGVAFGANSTSGDFVISVDPQHAVVIRGATTGSLQSLQFADGTILSMDRLVGEHYDRQVTAVVNTADSRVYGGTAADEIYVAADAHGAVVSGGRGVDHLQIASTHGATVLYSRGDGADRVTSNYGYETARTGENILRLGAGIAATDLRLVRKDAQQYAIQLGFGYDSISFALDDADIAGASRPFDRIVLADGSELSWQQLLAQGIVVGAPLADGAAVNGTVFNDQITGNSGDRTIDASLGDDEITAGAGAETLIGGAGNDRYSLEPGFGVDTINNTGATSAEVNRITFAPGLALADTHLTRLGDDLRINFASTGDVLQVIGFFSNPGTEVIEFADGHSFTRVNVPAYTTSLQHLATQGNDAQTLTSGADEFDALGGRDTVIGGAGNDTIRGGAGNDSLRGGADADSLQGGDGSDSLHGEGGDDVLVAGGDYNYLSGDDGNDVLVDGAGWDTLVGGWGLDTYRVFTERTQGQDADTLVIGSSDGGDVVSLADWVDPQSVSVLRQGNDIVLYTEDPTTGYTRQLTLRGEAGGPTGSAPIAEIRFEGQPGVTWTAEDLHARVTTGHPWNDNITGYENAPNTLMGGGGDDMLTGGNLADVLAGEAGNDTLSGGNGTDTYLMGPGIDQLIDLDSTGANILQMPAGVLPTDVELIRTGQTTPLSGLGMSDTDTLVVRNRLTGDETWVREFFQPNGRGTLGEIRFASGTAWSYSDIVTRAGASVSGSYSEHTGTAGDDVFDIDHSYDGIVEQAGEGIDTVRAVVSYVLPNNVENLDLLGTLALRASGNSGDNVLRGNAGNNYLQGRGGNDTYYGGLGDDTYDLSDYAVGGGEYGPAAPATPTIIENAGEGYDTLETYAMTHSVALPDHVERLVVRSMYTDGGAYWYHFVGNTLDNVIDASAPTGFFLSERWMRIDGGAGSDTMIGHVTDDTYVVDSLGDVIVESDSGAYQGVDSVEAGVSYTLGANLERLVLTGSAAIDGQGNTLGNVLDGAANTAGNRLAGASGDDIYRVDLGDTVVESANEGFDMVEVVSMAGSSAASLSVDTFANVEGLALGDALVDIGLVGNAQANLLRGNLRANHIVGGAGNDTITGSAQADLNSSSHGADTIEGGDGDDVVTLSAGRVDGGAGNDTIETRSASGSVDVWFGAGAGHDILNVWNAQTQLVIDAATEAFSLRFARDGYALIVSIQGGQDSVRVENFFAGQTGDALFPNGLSAVRLADGTLLTREAIVMAVGQPDLQTGTEDGDLLLAGGGVSVLDGGAGNDRLVGRSTADELRGGAGNDTLNGGLGADTYVFSAGWGQDVVDELQALDAWPSPILVDDGQADTVAFDATVSSSDVQAVVEGQDLILQTAGGDTLRLLRYFTADATGGRIEMIRFADGTQWDRAFVHGMVSRIVGTESDDYLYGMSFDSELRGLAGNDVLFGYGGSDLLDGGTGDDSLTGSDGNDTYVVDSTADTITEYAGEGTDTVQSSVTWTLSSTLENLTLTGNAHINGTGNTSANVLTGNAGNNTLDGKAGADTLAGGAGDDVYTVDNVGDTVTEGAGEGTDRVNSGVSFTLGAHVENLTLTGTSALNGTGNVLANSLVGNSGANRLDGGAGVDTLAGGTGNDTYVVDDTADVVTENASAGTDTVESSATFTLGSNVEHLTLTGAAAVNATGNTAANTLRGNAAANVLDGKGGTDTMIGGAGDDTYVVDVSTDVTTENASEGTDTVHSAVTRTLGNYLENLTLTGTAAINGTGNTLDNVLVGNSANNTLAGLVGNDIYVGGLGNDTLNDNSTTSNDVYRFGRGDGQDTLTDAGGSADRIEIGAGVSSSQLTQTRSGNNLVLGISGTTDTLTIVNWYASAANRIEEILLADGGTVTPASAGGLTTVKFGAPAPARTLAWRGASPETDRQAALLIESMAQFAAPSMAEPGDFMQPVKQPLPMVAANEWWLSK